MSRQHSAAAKEDELINNLVGWHLLIIVGVLVILGLIVLAIVATISRARR